MQPEIAKKECPASIAAFLNKHGADRNLLTIDGYQFSVLAFYGISINSINVLPDGLIQFQGNAKITRNDKASGISQSNVRVLFHGVAFMCEDKYGDEILYKVQIDQLKDA